MSSSDSFFEIYFGLSTRGYPGVAFARARFFPGGARKNTPGGGHLCTQRDTSRQHVGPWDAFRDRIRCAGIRSGPSCVHVHARTYTRGHTRQRTHMHARSAQINAFRTQFRAAFRTRSAVDAGPQCRVFCQHDAGRAFLRFLTNLADALRHLADAITPANPQKS